MEAANPILIEQSILERNLKAGNLSDSEKQTLCNQLEQLIEKLHEVYLEWMQILSPEDCTRGFVDLSDSRSYCRDLIKHYGHIEDCGNKTSLVLSTSAGDIEPNKKQNWYKKWRNRKRWRERRSLFQAFCYTWKQKRTKYCQLTIIEKTTGRRNGAQKPKS